MIFRALSDFLINLSATWFSAIFIIPQLTIVSLKAKYVHWLLILLELHHY